MSKTTKEKTLKPAKTGTPPLKQEEAEIKETDIKDPEFFSKRGVDKFNVGDHTNAIIEFDKAFALDDENPYYNNLRAHAKYSNGDLKGARSDFNKSKKLKTKGKKIKKQAAVA